MRFSLFAIMLMMACGSGGSESTDESASAAEAIERHYSNCGSQLELPAVSGESCGLALSELEECVGKKTCADLESMMLGSGLCNSKHSTAEQECAVTIEHTFAPQCTRGKAFLETCASSDECDSCLCNTFDDGGMVCARACLTDSDCPSPSLGCNKKGICKRS